MSSKKNIVFSSTLYYYYSRNVLQVHQHSVSKTRCSNCLKKKKNILFKKGRKIIPFQYPVLYIFCDFFFFETL